jgi:hemerythrin superfamily protein
MDLHAFLSADHERLDALLASCLSTGDPGAYDAFRRGLLRHIAIEERVLFPLLRVRSGRTPLEDQLHRDHAALSALLVPPPTGAELGRVASILREHNPLEEETGGLYEIIESLSGDELADVMARVHATPAVRVVPNTDSPIVRSSIEQLVREAEEGRRRFRRG